MVEIPVSLLSDMQQVPRDCPVALLMRHSARFPIINPSDPYAAMLTEEGVRMAEDLGAILASVTLAAG